MEIEYTVEVEVTMRVRVGVSNESPAAAGFEGVTCVEDNLSLLWLGIPMKDQSFRTKLVSVENAE